MTGARRASLLQLQASDPRASAWVNANAGSGKTHVLVDRLIRLMLAGTDPSRILCLTFTKAAAAEMSTRLYDRLSGWVTMADGNLAENLRAIGVHDADSKLMKRTRQLFTSALETPGGLKIQTIHAFCERLLQHFPVEAGIIPHFAVMDEQTASEALQAARQDVLAEAQRTPRTELALALTEIARHVQAGDFDDLVKAILADRANLDVVLSGGTTIELAITALRQKLALTPSDDAVSVRSELALVLPDYRRFAEALSAGTQGDRERAAQISGVIAGENASLIDLRKLYLTTVDEAKQLRSIAAKAVTGAHPWTEDFVAAEQQRLRVGLGKLADLEHIAATRALLVLTSEIAGAYEGEKRRRGAYDFDDLIIRTNRLLGGRPDAAWVLYKLDGGIEHVLLDEAQDTSPAQWNIARALTEEFFAGRGRRDTPERTLFAVGDRKQSIYSFQGADPDIFESVHDDFRDRIKASGQGFNDVDFTVSFRSTPEVLAAVDTVFDAGNVARQGIDGRSGPDMRHRSNRPHDRGVVEVWPLIEPEEREERQPWSAPVDREPANSPRRRLARTIAGKVKSWIGSRRIDAMDRTVEPGDILILVRVRNSFFDALIGEMRKEGVAVAGADRLKLMENIAILDLLALARFCLLAEDDHALACLLKSPLLATPFSEEQIFEIAWNRGHRSLWTMMCENSGPHCVAAVAQLSAWMRHARTSPPYEFFANVLRTNRRHFLARLGSEANDALDAFLESTLGYERDHNSSLQGFIHWFASGDIEIKRNMEQGANEVRIMTVHGAKGLEAPIVILPDTASIPDDRTQSPLMMIETAHSGVKLPLWRLPKRFESDALAALKGGLKQDRAHEYRRLLYVAMTRARDELYVCGYRGRSALAGDCWYNLVSHALLPKMREIDDGSGWRLGADPVFVDQPAAVARETLPIPAWALEPPEPEPDRREWAAPSHLAGADVPSPLDDGKPSRLERGILMHRVLQLLPGVAAGERRIFIRNAVIKAGHDEALARELTALAERPELAELFDGDGISEVPIRAELTRQSLSISGRIDRLILREAEILAVDYKTDRGWPPAPAAIKPDYLVQMAAYGIALKAIHPGMKIRCMILWTAAPILMEIPDIVLEQALDHNPVDRP
jgi:ATP-dependent helicase/nuclease subunit A